jgi:hypothetical protein
MDGPRISVPIGITIGHPDTVVREVWKRRSQAGHIRRAAAGASVVREGSRVDFADQCLGAQASLAWAQMPASATKQRHVSA